MNRILGLSTMTESAAAYLENGILKIASEEERFSRIKHQGGIPFLTIDYILEKEKINISDIDILAIYWNPYNLIIRIFIWIKISILNPKSFLTKFRRLFEVGSGNSGKYSGWIHIFLIKKILKKKYGSLPKKIIFYDHHLSHMASSVYWFGSNNSNIIVMDGSGESESTSIGLFKKNNFKKIKKIFLPNSLGHFYSYFTAFLGFKMLDGEYKLMGLAPYGKPKYKEWLKKNFLLSSGVSFYKVNYFNLDYHSAFKKNFCKILLNKFKRPNLDTFAKIDSNYLDLASSVQSLFEDHALKLANYVYKKNPSEDLHIVGGCGLNCKSNGVILKSKIYKNIYVNPVPNDSGGSVGAAFLAYNKQYKKNPEPVVSSFLGYELTNDKILNELKKINIKDLTYKFINEDILVSSAAKLLSENNIIAWCNGKMEFGARALGNRSFLANPRNEHITNDLNEKIKKRELFRPFAPSILEEYTKDYFDLHQKSEYMSFIVEVKKNKRHLIPAVTHHDNSARPQTVSKKSNNRYWKLLTEFNKLTNLPVLLNTSFNINEPIACSEKDCINTFLASGVKYLFIGNYFVEKKN